MLSLKDFIHGPYIKCPKCGKNSFSVSIICDHHYFRRCTECYYPDPSKGEKSHKYLLPKLNKKVIYIDQFAISNMMKFLNPATKSHRKVKGDIFWGKLFEQLHTLCKLQLIICPDSDMHETESLLAPYYESLKRIYELLSNGISFQSHETIKLFQIIGQFSIWIGDTKKYDLNVQDIVRKNIDKRTIQYSIRKAERVGIEIKEENNQYGIEEFYRLNMLTRKKHGVPSQPKKFFENLLDHMISKGHAFILLAIYDSKAIAGSMFFKANKIIHYKYNASDPDYLKKTSPNHSLTWHAIKQGCMEGYRFIDFGRTSPDNKGLMRYKEMWGAETIDLPYFYYPQIKGASSTEESGLLYRMVTGVWRSLPDPIIEKIGPMIYKHMG